MESIAVWVANNPAVMASIGAMTASFIWNMVQLLQNKHLAEGVDAAEKENEVLASEGENVFSALVDVLDVIETVENPLPREKRPVKRKVESRINGKDHKIKEAFMRALWSMTKNRGG